jgi:hypothetical protein
MTCDITLKKVSTAPFSAPQHAQRGSFPLYILFIYRCHNMSLRHHTLLEGLFCVTSVFFLLSFVTFLSESFPMCCHAAFLLHLLIHFGRFPLIFLRGKIQTSSHIGFFYTESIRRNPSVMYFAVISVLSTSHNQPSFVSGLPAAFIRTSFRHSAYHLQNPAR